MRASSWSIALRAAALQPEVPPIVESVSAALSFTNRTDGASNRTLVIVCGLMREFEAGAASLERQLFARNSGVLFDVAVITSSKQVCSGKDRQKRPARCYTHEQRLKAIGGVRRAAEVYSRGGSGRSVPFVMVDEGRLCEAWSGPLGSLAPAYHSFVVVRPDVNLTAPLDLRVACRARPGFNVISGSIPYNNSFHNADADLAYLACGPSAMDAWLSVCPGPWPLGRKRPAESCAAAISAAGGRCPESPVGQKWDFTGRWQTQECRHAEEACPRAGEFRRLGLRMGTLDALGVTAALVIPNDVPDAWRYPALYADPAGAALLGRVRSGRAAPVWHAPGVDVHGVRHARRFRWATEHSQAWVGGSAYAVDDPWWTTTTTGDPVKAQRKVKRY